MQTILIAGIHFTLPTAENIEETGLSSDDILADRRAVSAGRETFDSLLRRCLLQCDAERIQGWKDYVSSVVSAAEKENSSATRT